MRKTCLDIVYKLAQRDDRIFFIGSDLGFETLKEFRNNIPERFIMEGINEGHAVGMATGLAMEGKIVYLNTIATFITRRAFEQVLIDLCMHDVKVRLIGNGGGLVYAPLGSTHLAIEDIATMRAIPNMAIVAPCDAEEMKRLMTQTVDYPGPIYIRLAKGYDPVVSSDENGFEIGRGIPVRDGQDALIVTSGICLKVSMEAADILQENGIDAGILHMHTIKPLDSNMLLQMASKVKVVVSVEEHTIVGGLGSAVAETIAEANFKETKKFRRYGIPDIFPDEYGSQHSLMAKYGITGSNVAEGIESLMAT